MMEETGGEKANVFESCRYTAKSMINVVHLGLLIISKSDFTSSNVTVDDRRKNMKNESQ